MVENHRSDLVWNLMKSNPYVFLGLQRAGFTGGWLDQPVNAGQGTAKPGPSGPVH
jgi:hypothetical protein